MKKLTIYILMMILLVTTVIAAPSVTLGNVTNATSPLISPYTIEIHSPPDNATLIGPLIANFTVTSVDGGIACDLLVNGTIEDTNPSISHATPTQLTYAAPPLTSSTWQLNCTGNGINGSIQTPLRNFNTTQSQLTINVRNIQTEAHLTNVTINVTNTVTMNSTIYSNVTSPLIIGPSLGTYNVTVSRPPYFEQTQTIVINTTGAHVLNFDLGYNSTFFLIDERTLTEFNISSPDRITFELFCADSTDITLVTSTNFTIPITCQYTKFRFVLDYGPTNYYRTFILPPDETLGVNVYLIDLATTNSIFNNFVVDDLVRDYDNVRVFIKKVIGNTTEQITGDYVDIENSVGAFLIENNEYIIEIHSDNKPVRVMGFYLADTAGTKNLRLYDIGINSPPETISDVIQVSSTITNVSGTPNYVLDYTDISNTTNSVTVTLRTGTATGPVIYSNIVASQDFEQIVNMSPYINDTIFGNVIINHQTLGIMDSTKLLNEDLRISSGFIDEMLGNWRTLFTWLIVLLIASIAIMASIGMGDAVGIGIIVITLAIIFFGWLPDYESVLKPVLGLAAIVTIFSLLKKGDRNLG